MTVLVDFDHAAVIFRLNERGVENLEWREA